MPIYNDNRLLLGSAAHRALVVEGFRELIQSQNLNFDVIAGTATAGIPHATSLANALGLPLIYVRDKAKGHGLKNQIEGILQDEQNALVIEDLISTGGSSLRAVEAVREAGGNCEHCFSIFSYGLEKADNLFADANCNLDSLLTFPTLLEVAVERGTIDAEQQTLLTEWRSDPFGWGDANGFPKVEKG